MPTNLTFDKFLTDEEYDALSNEITFLPLTRDKLIIQTALATGARAQEILNLTRHDLIPKTKSVRIRALKGSKDREIPLNHKLFTALQSLASTDTTTQHLFPISYMRLYQIWQHFAPRINSISKKLKTFHCLRHTFAVRLYKKTKDIKIVQTALGHCDLRNTMVYVDFVYSQDHLRKAMGV